MGKLKNIGIIEIVIGVVLILIAVLVGAVRLNIEMRRAGIEPA